MGILLRALLKTRGEYGLVIYLCFDLPLRKAFITTLESPLWVLARMCSNWCSYVNKMQAYGDLICLSVLECYTYNYTCLEREWNRFLNPSWGSTHLLEGLAELLRADLRTCVHDFPILTCWDIALCSSIPCLVSDDLIEDDQRFKFGRIDKFAF